MEELENGSVIGNYRVVRLLGKGGMGAVYEVEHKELGTHYALKTFIYSADDENSEMLLNKFREEAKMLSRINHPCVSRAFDLTHDEARGIIYYVMDLVLYRDGESYSLEEVDRESLDEDLVYGWFCDACEALDHIHSLGIVHRDVKLDNFLLDADRHAVLADFGISRIFGAEMKREITPYKTMCIKRSGATEKTVLGSDHYIAPEVLAGQDATPAADAYGLGVMMFRLFTGKWADGLQPKAIDAELHGYKYRWYKVVPKLLEFDPARRPEHLVDLVPLLDRTPADMADGPLPAANGRAGSLKPPRKKSGVRHVAIAVAAAAVLCAAGLFGWLQVEKKNAEREHARQMQIAEANRRAAEEKAAAERAEKARIAAEQAKKESEAKRVAEERRVAAERKAAEERRIAEEKRLSEEKERARLAAEEKAKKESEAKRLAGSEEAQRVVTAADAQPDAANRVQSASSVPPASFVVPSPAEVAALMPKIEELTQGDFDALRSRRKTNAETAGALLSYISAGDEPAVKFILRQMAFQQYVLGSAFDKAEELYVSVRSANGIEYALAVAAPARQKMGRAAARGLRDRIAADEKSEKGIAAIKSKLAKSPGNAKLQEQLGMEYVACGDWEFALGAFGRCDGEIAKVAAWELSEEKGGDWDAAKVARFWWTLAEKEKRSQVADIVKLHAADWYRKAVALNILTGLDAKVAGRRIEEVESSDAQALVKERTEKGLYMIVDLTKVGKRAVSYLDEAPKGGWSDEYRTKKIAFRRVAPGSFEYMPGKSFKITKPFYIGVFEVTQKQYELAMKSNPSEFKGDMRPVEKVSYFDIRGAKKGVNWPKDNAVDNDSCIGKLRKRIGLEFDLPTEAQWEYACRAGTKGDFNVEGEPMTKLGKCKDNGGQNDHHVKVGSFLPNAWGIYDMHGNVWEWCLDRGPDGGGGMDWTADAKETDTDPKGPAVGSSRILRGGSWLNEARDCRSSQRRRNDAGDSWRHRLPACLLRRDCEMSSIRKASTSEFSKHPKRSGVRAERA